MRIKAHADANTAATTMHGRPQTKTKANGARSQQRDAHSKSPSRLIRRYAWHLPSTRVQPDTAQRRNSRTDARARTASLPFASGSHSRIEALTAGLDPWPASECTQYSMPRRLPGCMLHAVRKRDVRHGHVNYSTVQYSNPNLAIDPSLVGKHRLGVTARRSSVAIALAAAPVLV